MKPLPVINSAAHACCRISRPGSTESQPEPRTGRDPQDWLCTVLRQDMNAGQQQNKNAWLHTPVRAVAVAARRMSRRRGSGPDE
jgi:hypothetical protein